jgi:nicotinate dehydrogenase subunit A
MAIPVSTLRITVNGKEYDVRATPDTPLLYVLRNDLGLNAAKFGCGLGRCGACTVHLDGEAVHACMVPVADVAGRQVTTLEGLGTAQELHPLQTAFLDEQAAQCGYCAPGIIMTTAAFLERNPHLDDDAVREALQGALCRCGSQPRMLRAIRRVIDENGA